MQSTVTISPSIAKLELVEADEFKEGYMRDKLNFVMQSLTHQIP